MNTEASPMPIFVLEIKESRRLTSVEAVNESAARIILGEEWHLARLVPHAEVRMLFDEAVKTSIGHSVEAVQLRERRTQLAEIVARL